MSEPWHDLRINGDPNCRCTVAFEIVTTDGRCIGALDRCARHAGERGPNPSPLGWITRRFFYIYGFVMSAMQVSYHLVTWWRGEG